MSRNTISYHRLIALPLLLILLTLFAGCSNIQSADASSSPKTNVSVYAFSLPITQRLFKIITSNHGYIVNPDGARYGSVHYTRTAISSNYAGYAAQQAEGGNFSTVTSSWNMPAVSCSPKQTAEVAFWTGLTGSKSQRSTIAQIATLGSCQDGKASYEADWELFPAATQTIAHPIQPGDVISASVSYQSGQFHLTMQDTQQGWSFSVNRAGSANNATVAECITEAPTLIHGNAQHNITNLANFGQVEMSCQADNTPIGLYPQLSQYQMITQNALATTSELDNAGSEFHVSWQGK